jgi:hypothetical protein
VGQADMGKIIPIQKTIIIFFNFMCYLSKGLKTTLKIPVEKIKPGSLISDTRLYLSLFTSLALKGGLNLE